MTWHKECNTCSPCLGYVYVRWPLKHWLQLQLIWQLKLLTGLRFIILSRLWFCCCLCTFFHNMFSFHSTYCTLWTASFYCNDLLWCTHLVEGVNNRLLDNYQVGILPLDFVAYWTRTRPFKCSWKPLWLINWFKCDTRSPQYWTHNILIFWDTELWVFISCKR